MPPLRLVSLALVAAALAACGEQASRAPAAAAPADPAAMIALAGPLLVDPDLASQSRRFAVMSDPAPFDASLPPDDFARETIAAARAEARRRVAGAPRAARILPAAGCRSCAAVTFAERAAALGPGCGRDLEFAMDWGARMPAALPLYPRAHLREAAAASRGACPLRAASFTAPAGASEVLGFYRALGAARGLALRQSRWPGGTALHGAGARGRFVVIVRPRPDGLSEADLIVGPST